MTIHFESRTAIEYDLELTQLTLKLFYSMYYIYMYS